MPRPHLEFLQCQALPWQPLPDGSARPGTEVRQLSRDPASGAESLLIRYPAGWRGSAPHALACDEECFILEGRLDINGVVHSEGDYAYLPRGFARTAMASPSGAVVLTFFEGHATRLPADDHTGAEGVQATYLATGEMAWGGATEPGVAGPRVGRKGLRDDATTGERTWILSMQANEESPLEVNGVETHPCVEEMFLLSGSFHMPCGVMRAGAYFWRPPGIPHGPMGAREPFIALFRAKEGPFSTEWSHRGAPVPWNQPFDPVVPPGTVLPSHDELDTRRPW